MREMTRQTNGQSGHVDITCMPNATNNVQTRQVYRQEGLGKPQSVPKTSEGCTRKEPGWQLPRQEVRPRAKTTTEELPSVSITGPEATTELFEDGDALKGTDVERHQRIAPEQDTTETEQGEFLTEQREMSTGQNRLSTIPKSLTAEQGGHNAGQSAWATEHTATEDRQRISALAKHLLQEGPEPMLTRLENMPSWQEMRHIEQNTWVAEQTIHQGGQELTPTVQVPTECMQTTLERVPRIYVIMPRDSVGMQLQCERLLRGTPRGQKGIGK